MGIDQNLFTLVSGLHSVGSLEAVNGVWFDNLNGVLVPDEVFLKDETVTVSVPTTFDSISAQSIQVTNAINDVKASNLYIGTKGNGNAQHGASVSYLAYFTPASGRQLGIPLA